MKKLLFVSATALGMAAGAQVGPEVTSWLQNTTQTGYSGITSNCQLVQYSTNNVYVSCTCIPAYSIGPWNGNPNVASNQNFVYKITRNPQQNTGTATSIGLGHIGVWSNGVSIFNVSDAMSYNNQGIWNRNAYYWEGSSFDNCLGHPQQQGEYHHHVSPKCLYDQTDSTHHSPIIGYAFDGYPVYGAYAYTNTNGTGAIKRMVPSYTLSTNTTRTNGPAVSSSYPNGCFLEDHIYTAGYGDLDSRNGRFCVTPEYPNGTYAYFATLDAQLNPAFPYTFYQTYYGVVQSGNTNNGGHNTITESTTVYSSASGISNNEKEILFEFYPNPAKDYGYIYVDPNSKNNMKMYLYNALGEKIQSYENIQPSISYTLDLTKLNSGIYYLHVTSSDGKDVQKQKILIAK